MQAIYPGRAFWQRGNNPSGLWPQNRYVARRNSASARPAHFSMAGAIDLSKDQRRESHRKLDP